MWLWALLALVPLAFLALVIRGLCSSSERHRRQIASGAVVLFLGACLVALMPTGAEGQTFGQGILRVLINGVRQPSGVSEIQCIGSSSACYRDGGVVTIVPGSGGGGSGLPDGGPDNAIVRADGISTGIQTSPVTIDDNGNIVIPGAATIDGRDPSADGVIIDALPLSPLPSSSVSPGDAGFVAGTYIGYGATYNADAGYVVPSCRVALPLRSGCRFRVRWHGVSVPGVDASSDTVNVGSFCRIYLFRTNTTAITPVDAGLPAFVSNCETDIGGLTAGVMMQSDGGVAEPTIQGVAATHIRWTCTVDDIVCAYNP